jgi:hypothetical protein
MIRKANVCALDQLLLERFGSKVGRGLALQLARRRESSGRVESLFTPALTVCSQDSETRSRTGHNGRCKQMFADKRRECRAWT